MNLRQFAQFFFIYVVLLIGLAIVNHFLHTADTNNELFALVVASLTVIMTKLNQEKKS